jgi:hypothetical protein
VTIPTWPRLAWIASCETGREEIVALVGPDVEVADEWFCEGIWAGHYPEGDLDRTDLVFGSGARVRSDRVVFVSAGTTVDRLHSWAGDGVRLVSNSLPCLLALTGGALDVGFARYGQLFGSITNGLDRYTRTAPTTIGPVQVTYFNNLCWDGHELSEVMKPGEHRDLSSYERYRAFLGTTMERLAVNAGAADRHLRFDLLTTLSTGYDSPTAAVIANDVGCERAFGFDRSRGGVADSGARIAEILGLRYDAVDTTAWREEPLAAVPFLAAITSAGSSVSYRGAEGLLAGRVVFTGYHGDKVWDRATGALGPDIVRSDPSGTDLTEYRLWVAFVHCPVPFFGVRQIGDIHALSTAPELAPWDVGGGYSRPICRRIVEGRGVPRDLFGMRKKATAQRILRTDDFLTRDMRSDYLRWMRSHRDALLRAGTTVPRRLSRRTTSDGRDIPHQHVFHWAVDRAKEHYPDPRPSLDESTHIPPVS